MNILYIKMKRYTNHAGLNMTYGGHKWSTLRKH